MFYTTSEQYAYNLVYTLAREDFEKPASDLELADFQRAHRRWLGRKQPWIASRTDPEVLFCDDAALEENLLAALHVPSELDDLEHYKDTKAFKRVAADRIKIAADAAHAARMYREFRARDAAFWDVFSVFVTHVVSVESKFSWGGTTSEAMGVIYLVDPQKRGPMALYELLVHECTHLMMFVDQARSPHYRSFKALADERNFCRSAVYEMSRPLDKVLHSLVVATEVLLHRENVLGHHADTSVHPETPKLIASSLTTADAILALQARRPILAPRGVWLTTHCKELLRRLAEAGPRAKVA
jgi:hypothetical protein